MSPKVSEAHKDSKRAEILDAAQRVFIRKGYQAATMKDVVDEAGLSRGGVYIYFSSTEEMMLALLDKVDRQSEEVFEQALASNGSVWEALVVLFRQGQQEAEVAEQTIIPVMLEFLIIGWRSGKYKDLMEVRYKRSLAFLDAFLSKGVGSGEFKPIVSTEAIGRILVSFNDGLLFAATQFGYQLAQTREQFDTIFITLRHLLQVQEIINPEGE